MICRMLSNGAQSHYNGIDASIRSQHGQECLDRQCAARDAMYACGDQVAAVFDSKESIIRLGVEAWKAGVNLHNELLPQFANAAVNRLTI